MRGTWGVLCGLLLCGAGIGCAAWEREQLEEERRNLERDQRHLRGYLNQNAPVGSRWASHPDTQSMLERINRHDERIAEIDQQLGGQ